MINEKFEPDKLYQGVCNLIEKLQRDIKHINQKKKIQDHPNMKSNHTVFISDITSGARQSMYLS